MEKPKGENKRRQNRTTESLSEKTGIEEKHACGEQTRSGTRSGNNFAESPERGDQRHLAEQKEKMQAASATEACRGTEPGTNLQQHTLAVKFLKNKNYCGGGIKDTDKTCSQKGKRISATTWVELE